MWTIPRIWSRSLHRGYRVAGFPDHLHVFLDGIVHEQAHHVLPGHHHFPGHPVCKVEHIVNEPAFHRIDAAAFFTGTDHFPDVISEWLAPFWAGSTPMKWYRAAPTCQNR